GGASSSDGGRLPDLSRPVGSLSITPRVAERLSTPVVFKPGAILFCRRGFMNEPALTPMMQQYREMKARDPNALLLFRMGDFYEMFGEDAERASALLGLALTTRDKGPNAVPMAGFPHPALDSYLAKIVQAGWRAAVCEQVEDPRFAKGLVKREVVRVVTPGTLTDEGLLDPKSANYLAAIVEVGGKIGLAWA